MAELDVPDIKDKLHYYLKRARSALSWKLDGLSEYDARRPLTPTGTNLLGLVKHLACMEAAYFGEVFARPFPEPLPWLAEDAEPNADLWATADETREQITSLYQRACAHADDTIAALELGTFGQVAWWGEERGRAPLYLIMTHMIAETGRHCGHADIVRELIDGSAGINASYSNLAPGDADWWRGYRDRVEQAARQAGG